MVRSLDYGNIQFLYLGSEKIMKTKKKPKKKIRKPNGRRRERERERETTESRFQERHGRSRTYRVIAVDVGEADFGGVLESAYGLPPSLERAHLYGLRPLRSLLAAVHENGVASRPPFSRSPPPTISLVYVVNRPSISLSLLKLGASV